MVEKIVLMCPGVGSQYVGMGKNFYGEKKVFRETINEANDVLGFDIISLCSDSSRKDELFKLENAQLTLVAFSVGLYRVYMEEIGIPPAFILGHSLGEYSALCCAGAIRFPDVLELVSHRGAIINEVSAGLDGTMMWVVNLRERVVRDICRDVTAGCSAGKGVYISAFDSPTQTSISGETSAVMEAAKKLEKAGAIVMPLKMSGPFHSVLMGEACRRMKDVLRQYRFEDLKFPVVANRNALPYEGKECIIENLSEQLVSPIRWMDSLLYMMKQGVNTAVEIGPKDVLKFLVKKNSQIIQAFSIDRELNTLKEKYVINETEFLNLIGKCLGVAVSTKNRHDDSSSYETEVLTPYNKVSAVYDTLVAEGKTPMLEQVNEALAMVRRVMNAKMVPVDEQLAKMEQLLGQRVVRS